MILSFDQMEETVLVNFNGGEKELRAKMYQDERNKILHGFLEPGASIGLHTHVPSSEIIYILEGTGKVLYEGETSPITAGQCHYCPKGHSHSLINDSAAPLKFFAVVPVQ